MDFFLLRDGMVIVVEMDYSRIVLLIISQGKVTVVVNGEAYASIDLEAFVQMLESQLQH